ncbi:MAG: bifunctional nuclease domain-containing protein, partial [Bacteroidota bacterium]|nr:bifunctional nuclease domain-containing protein [Bacteroidota bacterium]
MEKKVRLRILGLTYSQTQTGSYALVLAEEGGDRRIPIMIGAFEAQAIALHLEELHPPRPLTHDLFKSFASAYGISLKEVMISKLAAGIFYSVLYFYKGDDIIMIDSRTSDAVALALRFKCPIFTSRDIIDRAGVIMEDKSDDEKNNENDIDILQSGETHIGEKGSLSLSDLDELKEMLQQAVEEEDYEKAAEIQVEISRRQRKR